MLGPGNDDAAREALAAWPHGLQVGGGIKDSNAKTWIDAGAEKVELIHYSSMLWDHADPKVGHNYIFLISFRLVLARAPAVSARGIKQRQGQTCH